MSKKIDQNKPEPSPVENTPYAIALGVNGIALCNECNGTLFKVGIAYNPDTDNNFIRILECATCKEQMLVVHQATDGMEPSIRPTRKQ